ncbi:GFA family protein [Bradyrhizobium sp. WSM3983]|uniref:GFA family protein n=1 Tax=Bradyrhizobium sp. WSM3983 TaxID=1038867 RepID=UPI00048A0678|nr:GFA family protein [Bradyrhizobium sp. WSM3983]
MIDARCSCGALMLSLPGPPSLVAACHCLECQRRTGAPFGVGAFYPVEAVKISGAPKEYVRAGESGGKVRCYFCPDCGSTVFWKPDKFPALIGVAVGAIADPNFPAPIKSVFERSKHAWVDIDGTDVEHLQHGSVRKTPS